MSAVYDNWERLVAATLRRENLRLTALRTPSDLSLVSASSSSSSFNFSSNNDQFSSLNYFSSSLVGDSFTYHQILKATDFLNESNLIKHGQSGDLYFGVLESGIEVVVKKFNVSSLDKEFRLISEMKIYEMVHHSRLIPLLGHCWENADEKFLLYKYMPNKDLSRFLIGGIDDDRGSTSLDWITRLKIATGAAEGLCYLHHKCFPPLVHRDIQASSILLDDEFEVRLGSLICIEEKGNNQNRIARFLRSTKGFEQSNSSAYDVYCFGKVLLELVTGKLGISTVNNSTINDWMASTLQYIVPDDKKLIVNIVDSSLIVDERLLMEIWAVAFVAKACLSPKPSKRPRMSEILTALKFTKLARLAGIKQVREVFELTGSSRASRNPRFLAISGSTKVYTNGEILARPSLRIFTYLELKDATRRFTTLQGEDEFGAVYRGVLHDKLSMSKGGTESVITVKRMHDRSEFGFQLWQRSESSESSESSEFHTWSRTRSRLPHFQPEIDISLPPEIELLGRISHPNILKLLGYCLDDHGYFLVYEFVEEGSLEKHLVGISPDRRLKILVGAAKGLAFLHELGEEGFFHPKKERQGFYAYFKCSKILIDSDYNAKITGFCVAKVHPAPAPYVIFEPHPIKFARLDAHAAPEYLFSGNLRLESDVYGFGVVLFQTLIGSKKYLLETRSIGREESPRFIVANMESRLKRKLPSKSATRLALLAKSCLQDNRKKRPSMEQVLEILQGIFYEFNWLRRQQIVALLGDFDKFS